MVSPELVVLLSWVVCVGAPPQDERISVTYDADAGTATVILLSDGGRVAWTDCLGRLARAKGFDDTAFADVLPSKLRAASLNIGSRWTWPTIAILNLALQPNVRMAVVSSHGERAEPALRIVLDRRALLATERRLKRRLREAFLQLVAGRRSGDRTFGLELDEGWQGTPTDRKLVILVSGLHASPEAFSDFLDEARAAGLACGAFRYPNDQPVAQSAGLLARELALVAEQQPQRGVALVGVSMGGLVSRAMLEDPTLDPGNVRQLVMVGVPNHGSRLAEFAFGLELWEHVVRDSDRSVVQRFCEAIEDGLGEANDDLTPGSDFLKRLNARPRNPNVRYSLLLGDAGILNAWALSALRLGLKEAGGRNRFVRFLGPRLDAALADLDEVRPGKGDGAVSVARGRLDGVDDLLVLPFVHTTMVTRGDTDVQKRLRQEIIRRLLDGSVQPTGDRSGEVDTRAGELRAST